MKRHTSWLALIGVGFLLAFVHTKATQAQTGSIEGTVRAEQTGNALSGVRVAIRGTPIVVTTDVAGSFLIESVPVGQRIVVFSRLGMTPVELSVNVTGNQQTVDVTLPVTAFRLDEIVVTAASRAPERVVEAPAATAVVEDGVAESYAITSQVPMALGQLPGVDVVQNDVHDFNLNTRGFNTSLTRRVLVLQDGRDLAIPFLGSQDWNGLSIPFDGLGQIEIVRGPGSALYGANAYSGVLNIITPEPRHAVGTRINVGGGELATMRADLSHAGVAAQEKIGYRVNAGYYRSESWTRSRTGLGDFEAEYGAAVDTSRFPVMVPFPGFEVAPLNGQSTSGLGSAATGTPDDLVNVYGSARLDYYANTNSMFTVEGGGAKVRNQTIVTGIGRIQIINLSRPWIRTAFANRNFHLMASYSGRQSLDPGISLASGVPTIDKSSISHIEGQYNRFFFDGTARLIAGGSFRSTALNSEGTLLGASNDDRRDAYYSAFGQFELMPTPFVRLVGALRFDDGDLFDPQVSPRFAAVIAPNERHSFRFTLHRAFQTPNALEYMLGIAAGPPQDLTALETGLRQSPLGPALAGVPDGELFTSTSAVPAWAFGNLDLDVEHVTSFEIGYAGQLTNRIFVSLDTYYSRLTDFVTDLLPGANPLYQPWTAPDAVPEALRSALVDAIPVEVKAGGLTRLPDGSTAFVASIGNAGNATEMGVELAVTADISDHLRIHGNYTFADFDIDGSSLIPGDVVQPNTPQHKANLSASYFGHQGLDMRVNLRLADSYAWSAGIFTGTVPGRQVVDATLGYEIGPGVRMHIVATNVFDQRRYELYGGSVIGRRVLGGVSVGF